VRWAHRGYVSRMDDERDTPEMETTDVLAEDEAVHVSPAAEELAESLEHASTFLPDVPDWDEPDQPH
jgi:hypothetical protein